MFLCPETYKIIFRSVENVNFVLVVMISKGKKGAHPMAPDKSQAERRQAGAGRWCSMHRGTCVL
jgi:hypothetical protein